MLVPWHFSSSIYSLNGALVKRHKFYTMARLHKENHYDRLVNTVEDLIGVKPMSIKDWVQAHIADFQTSEIRS